MTRIFTAIFGIVILSLSLAPPVAAGQFEDGQAAYRRQDYATALGLWRPLADQGDAAAQAALSLMYHEGQGVPQDYAEAARLSSLAAYQGDADAQIDLGNMYYDGQGEEQNYALAYMWFQAAADQGDVHGQFNVGLMYLNGQGVRQDYVFAHMWFNLAAAQGDQDATKDRALVAAQMTAAQIGEAQRLALEWKPTAQPTK